MHLLVSLGILLAASAVLFQLRGRLGLFWSASGFYTLVVLFMLFGFDPAAPASIVKLFCGTAFIALLLYITSSAETLATFWRPIQRTIVEPDSRFLLYGVLLLLPMLVAWQTYQAVLPSEAPPPRIRSIHPSPPTSIDFQGPDDSEARSINVLTTENPLRALETTDPEAFAEAVTAGKTIYYENCYFCHGDTLTADGHYASAVSPPPANFVNKDTIGMLTEGFLFWRVAKGGPGLPREGTPWDSSMPAWEDFLGDEEIWQVILFLYDYTGYRPRANETHGDEGEH